jgi:hypothetical protein
MENRMVEFDSARVHASDRSKLESDTFYVGLLKGGTHSTATQMVDNSSEDLAKELIGLAGEYAVASELCRRGVYAQLTLGNRKSVDLLIEGENLARIQVKTKQPKTWPSVKQVRSSDFLVLVDAQGKRPGEQPDFFVLNSDDYGGLVRREVNAGKGQIQKNGEFEYKSGWKGIAIGLTQELAEFKDQWDKILRAVGHTKTK